MKARIVITPDGQISVFTDEGTFLEGEARIKAIFAYFQAEGVQFSKIGQAEQHRHDHEGQGVHAHSHTGAHTH